MKIDLKMLEDKEQGFQYSKMLLKSKSNENSLKLWLTYYQWCLFYDKYEESKKIIKYLKV